MVEIGVCAHCHCIIVADGLDGRWIHAVSRVVECHDSFHHAQPTD